MAKYEKLKLAILNRIAENELKIGDRLLSEREIVDRFGFSRITVRHALIDLVESGYLISYPQSGYYLARPIALAEHNTKLGYLMVGRTDRMVSYSLKERLYRSVPFHRMHDRGIDIVARYEDDVEAPIINYFSSCAGLIMTDWVTDEWVRRARELKVPLCCVGNNLCSEESIPTIDYDYAYTVRELLDRLFAHNCKKVVIVISNLAMPSAKKIEEAYRSFYEERGVSFEERRIVKMGYSRGSEDYMAGMALNRDCDAVICDSLPNIFQYEDIGWEKRPEFALMSDMSMSGNCPRAIFPCFETDIYAEAAGMLLEHILSEEEMAKETLLRPKIYDFIKS